MAGSGGEDFTFSVSWTNTDKVSLLLLSASSENKSVAWKILLLYIHGTDWSKSKDR